MITSQEVKNVFTAIIKARPEIAPIARTKSARNYRYAPLDTVIELLSLVLPKHGLGWIQSISTQTERPVLVTRIIHESGEWIEDALTLPTTKLNGGANDSQELGASITYFKRYALSAMFGIATDDDTDGVVDARDRKQQVKATARAAQQQPEQSDEGRIADCAGAQIHSPTPAQPVQAVEMLKSTGDVAIDNALKEIVVKEHRGRAVFSPKTIEWLNDIITKKTPQEALASAYTAANKRINDINKDLGN